MYFYHQKGATAVLTTLLIMLVMLLSAVTIAGIFSTEIQLSEDVGKSTPALYGADSGEEAGLSYIIAENNPTPSIPDGTSLSGSYGTINYSTTINWEDPEGPICQSPSGMNMYVITAKGVNTQGGITTRQFQVCLPRP